MSTPEMPEGRIEFITTPGPDPLAKLPALAERLGVKPQPPDAPPSFVLILRTGETYDVFDLVNAALDRLDPR